MAPHLLGEHGRETASALLDKARCFPVLLQHVQALRGDPAGDNVAAGVHGMGRPDRGSPGQPEHAIGTMGQRRDALQLL